MDKRVIVVFTPNHIGDVLFTEPAIASVKCGYPDAHLIVVTSQEGNEVLKNHPAIDEIWVRQRNLMGWLKVTRGLRNRKPTLAVSFSPSSMGLAFWAFLSGAPKRVGFAFRPLLHLPFSVKLRLNPQRHFVDDYLSLVELIGSKIERRQPQLFVTEDERSQAMLQLQKLGWDGLKPIWGFHPFSSVPNKEWDLKKYAELINSLRERWDFLPVIFGSPKERERAEGLAQMVQAIVAAGVLSLREFIAAATYCSIFIGSDSGPTHIAAALSIPTLALFGPTNPNRTGPLGKQTKVVRSPTGRMDGLSIDAVREAFYQLCASSLTGVDW